MKNKKKEEKLEPVQLEFELDLEPTVEEAVEEIIEPVIEEVVEETIVEEVVEEPAVEEPVNEENTGAVAVAVVDGCAQLNVRQEPNKTAKVVCVITKGNELTVDLDNSTEDFYKINIYVKGVLVEGYCVKQFINIK